MAQRAAICGSPAPIAPAGSTRPALATTGGWSGAGPWSRCCSAPWPSPSWRWRSGSSWPRRTRCSGEPGRHPRVATECPRMRIVMGIDPGIANTGFGVVRVAGSRMTAIDGGTDRDRRRHGGRAAPAPDPRARLRADRLARARVGRPREHLLRQERPLGDRRRAGPRRRHAGRRGRATSRASTTRRRPSSWPSAEPAPPPRTRSSTWSASSSASRSSHLPTTPPMRSPSPSATPLTQGARTRHQAAAGRVARSPD